MKLNFFSLETVFKRAFRYLLKRYFGQYLVDFSQDELTYGLKHGKGIVENIQLNVEALNELGEEYNLPIQFLFGSIDFISIFVPWGSPLSENTVIEVKGLQLIVQPKQRPEDVSMFDSMWGSMTSSLQLAEECLNSNEDYEEIDVPDRSEGLEKLAKTIDAVLANMKIRLFDSSLKIEHILPNGSSGISLEIKISVAEYFDEAGINTPSSGYTHESDKVYEASAYSTKRIIFEGVSLYTAEFASGDRPFTAFQPTFHAGVDPSRSPEMPPPHTSLPMKRAEQNFQSEPVLISKLSGQQELRLKLKQNEAVIGPKVDVEFNLGAFNLFLTPQQVHLLFSLIKGLLKPTDTTDDTSKKAQLSVANKPMRPADYVLVEQELLRQQERSDVTCRSLKNQQGWSSDSLVFQDESDEFFHLMTMENKTPSENLSVSQEGSLSSSVSSDVKSECLNAFPSSQKPKYKGTSNVQAILKDPLSELTHFRGCISSLLIIILHDDSVQESYGGAESDGVNLKVQAEKFFNDLLAEQLSGFNFKDFPAAREPLSKLCDINHLRFMASGVVLDGNETSSSVERILKFNLSFYQLEILECLFKTYTLSNEVEEPKYMQLLSFANEDESAEQKASCFKLKYSQVECTSQNRSKKPPANKLDLELGVVICDIDISLTDRIRTLLKFSGSDQSDIKLDTWKDSEVGIVTRTSSKTEINISSPFITVNFRFPIPDLRPVHDRDKTPWWQQNVHKEILIVEFQEASLKTVFDEEEYFEKYEIQCQDIHGLFKLSDSEEAISFLRVTVDPDVDEVSRNSGFDWPRLVIRRMTKMVSPVLETPIDDTEDLASCSLTYTLMANLKSEPSPFCSTSVVHGNKADKEKNANLSLDHEEIIKPSSKDGMLVFVEKTVNKSECVFEFTLPTVNIVLPSRDFFELLYNRISNDLLLWENASLSSTTTYDSGGFKVHIPGLDVGFPQDQAYEEYPIFKQFSSDSNSDSEEEETMYMSVHEYCQRQKEKHKKPDDDKYTKYSFSFAITKGTLLINAPILDDNNEVLPEYHGKLQLSVEESFIYLAVAYKSDPNESYMCLYSEKSALYHDGMVPVEHKHPIIQPLTSLINQNLKCIIYESDQGMQLRPYQLEHARKEMLKLAVHIVRSPKQQIKTFKIAIEVGGATLRHYVVPNSQLWINQLIDFLKVTNYPVIGYIPPSVVTELHLNLSSCAIDYRPFKLPYRTAITLENFNMSCNVTATTPSFLFRIISEELRLFISNNIEAKKVDLKKNYVCIIDSGLIDISIRTGVDDKNSPKLEMCIKNNMMHIRTCSDSFKALIDLINYLSVNGDMDSSPNSPEHNENYQSYVKSKSIDSESEALDKLMADAMEECSIQINKNNERISTNSEFDYSNTDDEFCILEDDPGVGLIPRNGEPEIRILTDEPIQVIENYFAVPPGKSDVLKAPKHFPDPLFLLTLQEMSLIWHLFGGSDFTSTSKKKDDDKIDNNLKVKPVVTFSDSDTACVSFCNVTTSSKKPGFVHLSMENLTINENQKVNSQVAWLQKGGIGRNHEVLMELQMNKVQFQREVYPLDSEFASRYILLVNDIEIRDRLQDSKFNKFLYQYTSRDIPRLTLANMIDVLAVYTRPDPKLAMEECSLRVSCRPLRLNVDQDSLMFLVDFVQDVIGVSVDENSEGDEDTPSDIVPPTNSSSFVIRNVNQSTRVNNETFYKCFLFNPEVLIRIDYRGKRVQMEQGALKGILLGIGQLNASEIKLKRLCYRPGLLGHQKLISYALNEWQQDILKNQLPSLLGGVGPMHSFVQLFQGVKDLFYLPIVHYRRDGQLVRGIQRGASSFSTSTVIAALDLTSRFFYAVQGTAEVAYDMVSPGPRNASKFQRTQEIYRKNSQPADIIEGVATAYNVVKEGLEDTARTIYRVASTEHEHKGVPGAVGGVLRQIPPSLFKPIILGSEATGYVLDGVRHQLMPDAHQEDIHKWRTKNN